MIGRFLQRFLATILRYRCESGEIGDFLVNLLILVKFWGDLGRFWFDLVEFMGF